MKVRVTRIGTKEEGFVVSEFEGEVSFDVQLDLGSGFNIRIVEVGDTFKITSGTDCILVYPEANNAISLLRK